MGGLLVYIPTYNRPELLRAQLAALRPQVENYPRVRLVVADNASSHPDSSSLASEFSDQDWLTFFRRPSNIQGNANILQGFLHVKMDEYLWILADDTIATSNAVELLIRAIDETSPDVIGLSVDGQSQFPSDLSWCGHTFELITSKFSWGLISSAVYSGSYFLDYVPQAFFYHNSSFPHLGVMFSALRGRGAMKVSWLHTSSVHGDNSVDGPSDYSLAVVGFPQLMYLLEPKERRRAVNNWLRSYSSGFAHFSKQQPLSAAASLVLLRGSGIKARARLVSGRLEAWFRVTRIGLALQRKILQTPWLLEKLKTSRRLMFKV